jgi:hypothetical protein
MRAWRMFWIKLAFGAASGVLFFMTLAWPAWIEWVVGAGPDNGTGSLEWLICVMTGCITVWLWRGAGREHRRLALARKPTGPRLTI